MKKIVVIGLMLGSVVASTAVAQEKYEKSDLKNEPRSEKSFVSSLRSAGEIEASCRVKAKELAADTYRVCVSEQKSSQIEQIKKDYLAKIKALKSHYENELKKIGGKRTAVTEAPALEMNSDKEPEKTDSSEKPVLSSAPAKEIQKDAQKENAKPEVPEKSEVEQAHAQLLPEVTASPSPKEEVQPSSDDAEIAAMAKPSADATAHSNVTEVKVNEVKPSDMKVELKAEAPKAVAVKSKPSKATKSVKAPTKKTIPASLALTPKTLPTKLVSKESRPAALLAKIPKKSKSFEKIGDKITEMTVHLKPVTVTPSKDESTIDMPEPVPVENVFSKSSI